MAYVEFMDNLKMFNLEPEDTPLTVEEFRIMFEEALYKDKDNITDGDLDDLGKPRNMH